MLKVLLSTAAVALTATTVFAADLPLKAKASVPPAKYTWTGCYVGGHIGGVVSDDRTANQFGSSLNFDGSGFVGGGQVGCDYQFAGSWVIGGEGRAAWSSLISSHRGTVRNLITGVTVPSFFTIKNDFLASVTGRLGYVYGERWLVYARGGAAWTNEKMDDAYTIPAGIAVDPSASVIRSGWTVGAGVEWAFAPHWSANIEYNYYDFGSHGATLTGPITFVNIYSLKDTIHAATIGVNYHF